MRRSCVPRSPAVLVQGPPVSERGGGLRQHAGSVKRWCSDALSGRRAAGDARCGLAAASAVAVVAAAIDRARGRHRRCRVSAVVRAAVVEMEEATIRRAGEEILSEVDLFLPHGARAVIVGPNGCGKTTLLSAIAQAEGVEGGYLQVNTKSIGWLRQEAVGGSKKSVYEEAVSEMEAAAAKDDLAVAEDALAAAEGKEVGEKQAAYDEAMSKFEGSGGFQLDQKVEEVLSGLGFTRADFDKRCSELSGGWQMRVALARALLRNPKLLLLDEPTNHMDASAKRWLASYLGNGLTPDRTLLLVTHDRSLLDEMRCSQVLEISEKRIMRYNVSGIAQWEASRRSKLKSLQSQIVKLEKHMASDEDYIRRWGAKASHAAMAQSRKKKLAKSAEELAELKAQLRGLPSASTLLGKKKQKDEEEDSEENESGNPDGLLPLSGPGRVNFRLPEWPLGASPPLDNVLLRLKDAKVGYKTGEPVLDVDELVLRPGRRAALLGPNGCGKTTLLRTLAGKLEVRAGSRILGAGGLRKARVAFFTQDLAQDLPGDITPVEHVLGDGAPVLLDQTGARAALGALGLRGQCHFSKISTLSGGEKARVALAVFATRPADILLLDEPTNHLDGAAVAALCSGLRQHGGAVLVASHDKAFLEALQVTDRVEVARGGLGQPGSLTVKAGRVEQDRPWAPVVTSSPVSASAHLEANASGGEETTPENVRKQTKIEDVQRQIKIDNILKKIEIAEEKLAKQGEKMNDEYTEENYSKYQKMSEKIEKLFEELESLESAGAVNK